MDVAEGDLIRQVLAVAMVFSLLGVAVWKLRGAAPVRSTGARLTSVGRLALTPQHAVHVIQFDSKEVLVATHPQGCSLLSAPQESRKASA